MMQCSALGARPAPPISLATFKTIAYCVLDQIKQGFGLSPIYVPAVAHPGEVGVLTAPGVYDAMMGCCYEQRSVSSVIQLSSTLNYVFFCAATIPTECVSIAKHSDFCSNTPTTLGLCSERP